MAPAEEVGGVVRSPSNDTTSSPESSPEIAPLRVERLKCRSDFVRVTGGKRWHGRALSLQVAKKQVVCDGLGAPNDGTGVAPRIGFTLTKKVGIAVVRNRARRRLREAVRLSGLPVRPGHDYVIVGRFDAIRMSFDGLKSELVRAVDAVHDAGHVRTQRSKTLTGVARAASECRPSRNPRS